MTPLTTDQVQEQVEAIARDGFSIMRDAIDPEFLHDLRAELERLERVRPGGDVPPAPFTGHVTRRWFDVLNDAEIWQQVAVHPWIMQVLPHVLGEGYLLSTMGSAVVGHGEPAQPFHADDNIYALPRPHPNLVCNTMWALSDFTEETGATQVVPGSNRWDDDPDLSKQYDSVPLEMPAGSICFVVGTCYHGAGHKPLGRGPRRIDDQLLQRRHAPAGESDARRAPRTLDGILQGVAGPTGLQALQRCRAHLRAGSPSGDGPPLREAGCGRPIPGTPQCPAQRANRTVASVTRETTAFVYWRFEVMRWT